MSGRVYVEQYRSAPTSNMYSRFTPASNARATFVRRAASTCLGRSSEAGACDAWKDEGTPSGRALVLHVPTLSQVAGEGVVEGSVAVVRVQRKKLVDVAAKDDALRDASNIAFCSEHTRVGLTLLEAPVAKPREE
eukprot:6201161-Pleurochrysis_carterae.AAC.3